MTHDPNSAETAASRSARSPKVTIAVVLVGGAVALSLFGDMAMYAILPIHYPALGLSPVQVGLILSMNRAVRLVTNSFARYVLGRWRTAAFFPLALLIGSGIALAYSTIPLFPLLLGLRACWGLCWSFIRHTGVMTAVTESAEGKTGRFMGLYQAVVQLGFIGGSFFSALLFDSIGFSNTFIVMAAVSAPAVILGGAGVRLSGVKRFSTPARSQSGIDRRALLLYVRGALVALVGTGLIMSTLGYVLKTRVGDTLTLGGLVIGIATVNGTILAARYVTNGIGSPLIGILIDKTGPVRTQLFGCLIGAVTMVAAAVSSNPFLMIVSVFIYFVGGTAARLAMQTQAGLLGPRAYASLATGTDLGAAVGPFLGWVGVEVSQSGTLFPVSAALLFIAALLSIPDVLRGKPRNGNA